LIQKEVTKVKFRGGKKILKFNILDQKDEALVKSENHGCLPNGGHRNKHVWEKSCLPHPMLGVGGSLTRS
jgi:hypothetical protein